MAIQFAGAGSPAIKAALSAVLPKTKGEALLRFGPDLLYAGLAAIAPEGTSREDRAASLRQRIWLSAWGLQFLVSWQVLAAVERWSR